MVKSKIDGVSDYVKIKEELDLYKSRYLTMEDIIINLKRINKKAKRLEQAEKTLRKVKDLITSNEELVHFENTKKEIVSPIEEYFKKVK